MILALTKALQKTIASRQLLEIERETYSDSDESHFPDGRIVWMEKSSADFSS